MVYRCPVGRVELEGRAGCKSMIAVGVCNRIGAARSAFTAHVMDPIFLQGLLASGGGEWGIVEG